MCSVAAASALTPGRALEIEWTRMAGQWPVETSPVVGDFNGSGKPQILVLNRGGQLLHWRADGTAIGAGQDGLVAQLPAGRWTTAPTPLGSRSETRLVAASVEGLVVGLGERFDLLWQHKLPGETVWGRALPAMVRLGDSLALAFSDESGTVTCLTASGNILWTNIFGVGPCSAPPLALPATPGAELLFVPGGSALTCCDASGRLRWRKDLGSQLVTRPELLSWDDRKMIVCGTAAGALIAVDLEGKIVWERATGDTFSNWIVVASRQAGAPLMLFTGLWGNLYAVDVAGAEVWTSLFRAKTRAAPLVLEAAAGGHAGIFVPTFHQHVFEFGPDGSLRDDLRLEGIMPTALVPISEPGGGRTDLLVTTTTLLAYRLRLSPPKSPYGPTPAPRDVRLESVPAAATGKGPTLRVDNPEGGLINVRLALTDAQGRQRQVGTLTSRSLLEVPLPAVVSTGKWSVRAAASDVAGQVLCEAAWQIPQPDSGASDLPPEPIQAWPTAPYGPFVDMRLAPSRFERRPALAWSNCISIEPLYLDEADAGAFVVSSQRTEPTRARAVLTPPARADGAAFRGAIQLREVVPTGSVNGEWAADALPALNAAGLFTVPARRATKIWVDIDTRGAQPGVYTGQVEVALLDAGIKPLRLPLRLEVLDIRLPKELPLKLCAWDYVPNRWFPAPARETLEDMSRHGVNIFPRSTVPPGRVDAAGKLAVDWAPLDAELARLDHRGVILFHLNHPPIDFGGPRTDQEKRPVELEYIRALRDHLSGCGWGYDDYAFYLLDEPGLDYGANLAVLLEAGQLIREADPRLRTYTDPVPGLSWRDLERIEPFIDVWAPNMRLVSGLLSKDPRMQRILKARTVWSYECVSQVKSLSPLRYNRANAWRAWFFGLTGVGFWTHSTTEADHWLPGKTINDEYALVYPGETPVPSVRWEAVRDGLEDVAAIALLEQEMRRHRQAGTRADLVRHAEARLRIALRDVMELSDETYVESRDFLRQGDRLLDHTWSDVEAFQRHRAEIARLTLALRQDAGPPSGL